LGSFSSEVVYYHKKDPQGAESAGPRAWRVKILPREKRMASDEKVFNMKVVRNVETVNFAFGVIII
jgi:hypothetical protein